MVDEQCNVSGTWLGNYYYELGSQPFGFEAVFIEIEGVLEGSILDDGQLGEAHVFGSITSSIVSFTKKYSTGAHQPVFCEGTVSDEGKKITGRWHINNQVSGGWMAWRQDEEETPDLETEDEKDQFLEDSETKRKHLTQALPTKSR